MSRSTYAPKESYTGNGATSAYTFDFKIETKSQLLIVVLDDSGVEVERVRGTDTTYLSSVTFDSNNGAGTVNLAANLTTDYKIYLLLANDAPTQPYEFRNKSSFTLKRFEEAMDFMLGAVQRLAFMSLKSIRLHPTDDETAFDAELPEGVVANGADRMVAINLLGTGLQYGPTVAEITTLVADAAAAATLATEAAQDAQYLPTAIQTISASGTITIVQQNRQHVRVQSSGGNVALSNQPFGSDTALFQDGMEIVVEGVHATNFLTLLENNGAYGYQGNGGLELIFPNIITFIYNSTKERFLIKSTGAL